MIPPDDFWFFHWLGRHKALNRSAGWKVFEAEGDDVYGIWADEFGRLGVTEAEADAASHRMAREPSRFPEHHLGRLVALVREARAERDTAAARADRDELAERDAQAKAEFADARAGWDRLPAAERDSRIRTIAGRYSGVASSRRLVERWAIDEWRGVKLPDPAGFAASSRAEPTPTRPPASAATPPTLSPERERELIERTAATRRAMLAQLRTLQDRQPAPQHVSAEPTNTHPTSAAI